MEFNTRWFYMRVLHKVALHGGSTQDGYTWGFNTRWLYMGVQHKVAIHGVQHKVVLYEGSTQGGYTWSSTQGGST